MVFKKIRKTIFGVDLNASEQKAVDDEIKKHVDKYIDYVNKDIVILVLYILHKKYGFGEKRLHKFYDEFDNGIKELTKHYELDQSGDDVWICNKKLKEDGINVDDWD